MIETEPAQTYSQQAVLERLHEMGLLQVIRTPLVNDVARRHRPLIPLDGRPGSRVIVEERR
jgi:hypothetical protein